MAHITIKHLDGEAFREMSSIYKEEERLEYARETLKSGGYVCVADTVLGGSLTNVLNEAYYLTNSVDYAWYENEELLVSDEVRNVCRSTSVGDIIEINGDNYMVAGVGFSYVELEEEELGIIL